MIYQVLDLGEARLYTPLYLWNIGLFKHIQSLLKLFIGFLKLLDELFEQVSCLYSLAFEAGFARGLLACIAEESFGLGFDFYDRLVVQRTQNLEGNRARLGEL